MDWITLYIIAGILILPVFIYGSICQVRVNNIFDEELQNAAANGTCAAELAYKLLAKAGVNDVKVVKANGRLTDCYNPKYKVIKLSTDTYYSSSIAALGVMAHEVGHAIQHNKKVLLFRIRQFLSPVVGFVSKAFFPLVLLGSIFNIMFLLPTIGYYIVLGSVIFYGASLIFELITLPLEFDASKRAMKLLSETGTLNSVELSHTKKVLSAAAQTYIASFASTLLYFIRFFSLFMTFHKDD